MTTEVRPLDPDDPDVRKLALIDLAIQRGVPWSAVARALGVNDKTDAKKIKAQLEKRVKAKQRAPHLPTAVCEVTGDGVH